LATGTPFASFSLAQRLSQRLQCAYVLDYRDPWSGNPHASGPGDPAAAKQEAQLLLEAAAVTIVSPSWASALDRNFGVGDKLHVLTNGYDPEESAGVEPQCFGHFAIVYAGAFYPPKRVITPVMEVLRKIREGSDNQASDCYFHYYGPHEQHVRSEADRCGVSQRVVLHGNVSRAEALAAQRGANVAVVITSALDKESSQDDGIVTSKIFEIMALGVPALLISPAESDAGKILAETGLGRSFQGKDVDEMARWLKELMSYKSGGGKKTEAYSWINISAKMDRILRGVLERSPNFLRQS